MVKSIHHLAGDGNLEELINEIEAKISFDIDGKDKQVGIRETIEGVLRTNMSKFRIHIHH